MGVVQTPPLAEMPDPQVVDIASTTPPPSTYGEVSDMSGNKIPVIEYVIMSEKEDKYTVAKLADGRYLADLNQPTGHAGIIMTKEQFGVLLCTMLSYQAIKHDEIAFPSFETMQGFGCSDNMTHLFQKAIDEVNEHTS